jgi:predicted thioesterase
MRKRKSARGKQPAKRTTRQSEVRETSSVPEDRPPLGLEAIVERVVEREYTIQALDPNLPAVLSTPAMIGLMEHASVIAVRPQLAPGVITVGTRIEVDHMKAVPPGATVRASARLVKYEGRFLVFDVEARSGEHLIGRGRVFRAIVHAHQHGAKAQARIQK